MVEECYLFELPLFGQSKEKVILDLQERAKKFLMGIGTLSVVYVSERKDGLHVSTIVEAPRDASLTYTLYEIGGEGAIVSLEE